MTALEAHVVTYPDGQSGIFGCDDPIVGQLCRKVFRTHAPEARWGPGGTDTGHGTKPQFRNTNTVVQFLITLGIADTTVTPNNGNSSLKIWGMTGWLNRHYFSNDDQCSHHLPSV